MVKNLIIRPELEKDYSRITEINDLAFGQTNEGILVEKLRQTDNFISRLSLVAELNNLVVGHILFYPVIIKYDTAKYDSLSLSPMSVIPKFQRRGIGSKLVVEGLKMAKILSHKAVIVIGHSEYYPRFGFEPASKWNIKVPFDVPDNAFLALELISGGLMDKSGTVIYPEGFNDV